MFKINSIAVAKIRFTQGFTSHLAVGGHKDRQTFQTKCHHILGIFKKSKNMLQIGAYVCT